MITYSATISAGEKAKQPEKAMVLLEEMRLEQPDTLAHVLASGARYSRTL